MNNEIKEMNNKIKKIVADELGVSLAVVKDEANIIEDLNADSLAIMQIIMTIEDEFSISIPQEDIMNIKTIKDIFDYAKSKK